MDSGTITVAGGRVGYTASGETEQSPRRLAQARADARIGMVFQHFNLFPYLSALQHVMAGPVFVYGQDKATARAKADKMRASVGLADHADKRRPRPPALRRDALPCSQCHVDERRPDGVGD